MQNCLVNTDFEREQIENCISKGIDYLFQHQYPNGEFCVYLSGDDAMQEWNLPESSIFPSALIGSCLLFLKNNSKVEEILDRTASFLRYQMGCGGTWNHYGNFHPYRQVCPQDADDTACVSSFLIKRNIDFPKQQNISLLLDNRRKDGLFYTWFTFHFQWNSNKTYWRLALKELMHPVKSFFFWKNLECTRNDVDTVVNANVLYYLGNSKETQPVIELLLRTILENRENNCDKWYRNIFTVYYFITRNYYDGVTQLEPVRETIIKRILSKFNEDGSFGEGVADTAFAVCALLNLNYSGEELKKAIHFIIQSQQPTGNWLRWRIYYGGPKKIFGFGSEELTTAFCLEALQRYGIKDNDSGVA